MRFAIAPPVLSLLLIAAMGAAHGIYTDRWGQSNELDRAITGLTRVPVKVGDWVGEDVPYEVDDMTRAGIRGTLYRRFQNSRTGETVSLLIVCGRGGPICVHTPDVCYAGAGYQQVSEEKLQGIESGDGRKDFFKVVRFGKPGGVVPTQLEIYWAWSQDGVGWQAPVNPRLTLARSPALYKLYAVREFTPKSQLETADSCQSFLRRVLPTIRQTLPYDGQ